MMKRLFLFLFLFLLVGCAEQDTQSQVIIAGTSYTVEVVQGPEEKEMGLMFREKLCNNCGMLFIFDEEDKHGFWMKNTLIPLDMVHINKEHIIVDVLPAVPCETEICDVYVPKAPSLYVLEVDAGTFSEVHIGQPVVMDL